MRPLIAALGLLVGGAPGPLVEPDWTTRYEVLFDRASSGTPVARVRAEVTWSGGRGMRPQSIGLGMADDYEDERGQGYGRFVSGFEALVPDGSPAPRGGYRAEVVDAARGEFRVPLLKDGRAGYAYTVTMGHAPREALGFDETPHAFEGGAFWTGRSLFVREPDSAFEVSFEVRDAGHVSTSLDPVENRPGTYSAPRWFDLRQTFLVVGDHHQTVMDIRGSTVVVALDDRLAERGEAKLVLDQVRTLLEAGSELFDGRPPARAICFVESHRSEGGGAVVRRDAHVLVPPPPLASRDDQWRRSLCHELFHLWNPNLVGFDSREMWYSEGFTEYWSHVLLARTGGIEGADLLRHMRGWVQSYLEQAGEVGLREAGELGAKNNILIYQGGALAAFCMDVALREKHGNRRGLADVMRALYERCGSGAGDEVSIDELQGLLEELGGSELEDFLERHVAGSELLPLERAFQAAGIELFAGTLEVPERDSAALLLQTPGMTGTGGGIRIQRTNAGKLKSDDLLIEVDGLPTDGLEGLCTALAGRQPGDQIPAVVVRRGKRVEVEVRLGGHGEDLPGQPREVVRLRPIEKPTKRSRAIREALFPGL